VYIPDVIAIAGFYKDWASIGGGLASQSVMSYGDFPDHANDYSESSLLLPRGAIINGKFNEIHPIDLYAPDEIQEFVTHSWYSYGDDSKGLHPFDGITAPKFELGANHKGTKPASSSWTNRPSTRGSSRRAGRATPWK
jgi:hydrogenase large subunit